MTTFTDLGLSDALLKAVKDVGYETPTPIQEKAIPLVLQMRDVLGCAQTGTGKTAGFTLPMIDILAGGRARARMPRSLVLEPTRELATQVAENFRTYGKYHPQLSMALLIGGENMDPQIKALERGVDVLIATPGRLLDLFDRGRILLNDMRIFVIDEADRMLDMGFIPDIEKISALLPFTRQTLLFSATMPPEIRKLADKFLQNPKEVSVTPPASTAENIDQSLIALPSGNDWQKREALRILLREHDVQNAFIFCNRKRDVALLHKSLTRHGFNVGALHGDLEQSVRTQTLDSFRAGTIALLVCSDVAARGLDIADVSHVFNFDVPFSAEDYVHRIGRTGRAGKTGRAMTLVTPDEGKLVAAIETLIKKKIPSTVLTGLPEPKTGLAPGKRGRAVADNRHDKRHRTARARRHEPITAQGAQESAASVAVAIGPAPKATVPPAKTTHAPHVAPHKESASFGANIPSFLRPRTSKRAK